MNEGKRKLSSFKQAANAYPQERPMLIPHPCLDQEPPRIPTMNPKQRRVFPSSNKCLTSSNKKLLVTGATLLVTSALLVVTKSCNPILGSVTSSDRTMTTIATAIWSRPCDQSGGLYKSEIEQQLTTLVLKKTMASKNDSSALSQWQERQQA